MENSKPAYNGQFPWVLLRGGKMAGRSSLNGNYPYLCKTEYKVKVSILLERA